ncbi:hypothetical protein [Actinophytocola sp.]|uniref:hypothetical protein n=1 Tax=Actinophytocola sp. TaxID=1872138 RepID=UPI00389A8849
MILQTSSALTPGDLDRTTVGRADGQFLTASTSPDGTTAWTGVCQRPKPRLLAPFWLVVTKQEQYAGGGKLTYSDVIRL